MSRHDASQEEIMSIRPLGGGNEVGRSCIILQFKGRNIMLDCGHHPGREGIEGLPYFNYIEDPSVIDMILITHFHIDHCGALPYFTEKCHPPFTGRIFMTHATKAVMRLLLSDQIKLTMRSRPLYTEEELNRCLDKIECIDFHQTIELKGVKFSATAAGHVLGACMYSIEIDGIRVLYTGDYSLEPDRHLLQAAVPVGGPPDVMIVESTFGITNLPGRAERESKFTSTIDRIVRKGGSCLIPVFALGRAQELLLILDEYWQANPDLQNIPVFYASKMAHKALRVYQTFVNMMNDHIRTMMDIGNPFKLAHVKNMLKTDFDVMGACVVMASPGFLQNGVSRHLFERWCDDARNGVIIAGYTVEGTLAHTLLEQPQTITCQDNSIKPRRCHIEHISFSAHVDYSDNLRFIKQVAPDNIILVHGEKNGMKRLKEELVKEINKNWPVAHKPPVAMPDNQTVVKLRFSKAVTAECVGTAGQELLDSLVEVERQEGLGLTASTNGGGGSREVAVPKAAVLVSENFVSRIVTAAELPLYTSCRRGRVVQKIFVPVPVGLLGPAVQRGGLLRALVPYLDELFESVVLDADGSCTSAPSVPPTLTGADPDCSVSVVVQGVVRICEDYSSSSSSSSSSSAAAAAAAPTSVLIVWEASPTSDMVADCSVGSIMQTLSVPSLLHLSLLGQSLGGRANEAMTEKGKRVKTEGGGDGGGAASLDAGVPMYKGHKRRNVSGHTHVKAEPPSSSSSAGAGAMSSSGPGEEKLNAIVAKMQSGTLDPSKALPADCVTFSLSAAHSHDNRTKLENLKAQLEAKGAQNANAFSSIKLTADGLKLIFTAVAAAAPKAKAGAKRAAPDQTPAEAFVYVAFALGKHEAVVSCEDATLKAAVVAALASLA